MVLRHFIVFLQERQSGVAADWCVVWDVYPSPRGFDTYREGVPAAAWEGTLSRYSPSVDFGVRRRRVVSPDCFLLKEKWHLVKHFTAVCVFFLYAITSSLINVKSGAWYLRFTALFFVYILSRNITSSLLGLSGT